MHLLAAEVHTPLSIRDGIPFYVANVPHREHNHFEHWIDESLRN